METLGVILSGKYADLEITQQYGLIPPSFLPLSGQRLFISQVAFLRKFCTKVFLTIPLSYELTSHDKENLEAMKVTILRMSPDISINEALIEILTLVRSQNEAICVLYGDTLIDEKIPINSVTIFRKPEAYSWGRNNGICDYELSQDQYVEMMMAGLFFLSDSRLLESAIHRSDGSILNTLDVYSSVKPLVYVPVATWNDFGHLGTLQQSRLFFSESRYFNSVKVSELGVIKQSTNIHKLRAEIAWYENLPVTFKKYTPNLIAQTDTDYTISYIPFPTLHELLIFGNLSSSQWMRVFDRLRCFFLDAREFFDPSNQIALVDLLKSKTEARCKLFLSSSPLLKDFDYHQLTEIFSQQNIEFLLNKIRFTDTKFLGVLHGDMCATNIFWDSASDSLMFVDPRGDSTGKSNGLYGDIRYDIAKLYQSFIAGYDGVLSGIIGSATTEESSKMASFAQYSKVDFSAIFESKLFEPLDLNQTEIAAITTLLMLGLLPLHADRIDRQNEFVHIIVDMLEWLSL
jgi:hypothetical protein